MNFVAVAILFQLLFLATRSTKESFLIGSNCILICVNNSSQIRGYYYTEAAFIKYFNDSTVVFNNQIIAGVLLLITHCCKHYQTRGLTVLQNHQTNLWRSVLVKITYFYCLSFIHFDLQLKLFLSVV